MYFHILLPWALAKQLLLMAAFKLLVWLQPFPGMFAPLILDVGFMFLAFLCNENLKMFTAH